MGRRKERRLAAISAAGRRVKLDLFAEPIGEVAGKPLHDEAGGGLGQEKCADIPNSPSSSATKHFGTSSGSCFLLGQKQENPLLLLGQYSDEEVDDSTGKRENITSDGTSPIDTSTKVEIHVGSNEDSDHGAVHAMDNSKPELDAADEFDGTPKDNPEPEHGSCIGKPSSTEISSCEDFSMQIIGDYALDWKVVMHEESKRCYYWNTQTGATSWEVPDVSTSSDLGKIPALALQVPNPEVELTGANADGSSAVSVCGSECVALGASVKESSETPKVVSGPSGAECEIGEIDRCDAAASESDDFSSEHLASARASSGAQIFKDTSKDFGANHVHENELIKKCENILERLNTIGGSGNGSCQPTWANKYIIEVETRLFDCKELLSFGSSILPFWRNTEIQLERIETAIREETSGIENSGDCDKDGDPLASSSRSENLILEKGDDEVLAAKDSASKSQEENLQFDIHQHPAEMIIKSESPDTMLESDKKEIESVAPIEQSSLLPMVPKVESDDHEEVDMDVEMEVDDEIPTHSFQKNEIPTHLPGTMDSVDSAKLCPLLQHAVLSEVPPLPSNEFKVPPPPDEEWVPPLPPDNDQPPPPPPPPDNDPIPPPPIEEPPVMVTPYAVTMHPHPLPYAEQYDVGYSAPCYQYYVSSGSEGQIASYYTQSHVDGSHVVQAHPAQYFGADASASYPSIPATIPVEPAVSYDVHGGIIPPAVVGTSFEASAMYTESKTSNPSKISTGSVESVGRADKNVESVSQKIGCELAGIQCAPEKASIQIAASSVASTMTNASANESVAAIASAASVKNPSKAARTKKRVVAFAAPTLRSNKKVSGLVDKWKAAKEELHGDEDDKTEDAYEILEKKRKREIEEWHAQQIASGEAQDNANFVPIRGDWRARVKRKRKTESSAESTSAPAEQVVEGKRQPDLVELAKGLPPGWQAYYDESSKEVYYGNLRTSETTWTRPTS